MRADRAAARHARYPVEALAVEGDEHRGDCRPLAEGRQAERASRYVSTFSRRGLSPDLLALVVADRVFDVSLGWTRYATPLSRQIVRPGARNFTGSTNGSLTFIEASLAQSRFSTSGSPLGQRPARVRAALRVARLRIAHVGDKARDSPSESARSPREPAPEPWG
jgi:hypothetical protein